METPTCHLTICRASGHRYLIRQIESLWQWFPSVMLYEGMRRQEELSLPRLEREPAEHQALLAALRDRDAERAQAEMRDHIRNLSRERSEVLGLPETLLEPQIPL